MRTRTKLVSLSLAVVLPLAGMVNAGAEEKPAQGKQENGVVAPAAGTNGEAGKGAGNAAAGNGASGNQAEAGKGAASGTGAAGKPGEKAGGSSAKVSGSSDKVKGSSERGKAGSSAIAENKDNKTLKFLGIIAGIVGIGSLISAGLTWAVQQRLIANPLPGIIPNPPAPPAPAPAPVPAPAPAPVQAAPAPAPAPAPQGGSFRNCAAARAAGVRTPIHRGEPAYAPHLDRDNDGVACER